ncbi:hypothetical protein EAF00_002046 [Botryotinia globosa]|nr:hypothetical protein EAF00_002046 [Botryotinia globosa]
MDIVNWLNSELIQSLLVEIPITSLLTIEMAPIARQTRNVPRATSFPRVSKEIMQNITRRDGSSTATIFLGSSTASKFKDQVATIRSVTSPVAVLNLRSTTTPQVNVGETTSLSEGAIVGIVLGSIVGFLVLLVFGYMCCVGRRSAGWTARYGVDGDGDGDEMVYGDRRDSGGQRGRVWKSDARGGGGEDWEMGCDGDEIRRPDKVVVREGGSGSERTYRRTRRELDRKRNDNYGYDRRNGSREWERRGSKRRRRGRRRRRSRNTWVVIERRGIFSWGKPVRKLRGRSLRRETEMSGECGEFGRPVRSWRGEGRNGRGGLRFDVRD